MVLAQSFRNPALLGKMASSLDVLSGGRFDLYLGAGWKQEEYKAYGYPFPNPGIRIKQLREYISIIRHLTDPNIDIWDFEGEFWTLIKNRNFPKPITQPFPIYIGGQKPKITKLAAHVADGLNVPGTMSDAIPVFDLFDKEVRNVGRRSEEVTKSYFGNMRIFQTDEEALEFTKDLIQKEERHSGKNPIDFLNTQPWGTRETIAEKMRKFIAKTRVDLVIFSLESTKGNPLEVFWDEIRQLF